MELLHVEVEQKLNDIFLQILCQHIGSDNCDVLGHLQPSVIPWRLSDGHW